MIREAPERRTRHWNVPKQIAKGVPCPACCSGVGRACRSHDGAGPAARFPHAARMRAAGVGGYDVRGRKKK